MAIGSHEPSDYATTSNGPSTIINTRYRTYRAARNACPDSGCTDSGGSDAGDTSTADGSAGSADSKSTQPVARQAPSDTGSSSSGSGSGSGGTNTNSSSPEFNTLAQMLQAAMMGGAPVTPYQQQGDPTVIPTQTQGSRLSAPVVALFAVAGALGYYYWRKHGGPGLHEAL